VSTSPVRVLHVLACDELAGTERMVISLILGSDDRVVCHELATLQAPGPVVRRLAQGSRWAASLGGGRGGLPGTCWRLARLLRGRKYDVVNAYGLKASVLARVLVRTVRPRPVFVCGVRALHVTEVERLDSVKGRAASLVERRLSTLVDLYDANSRAALTLLAELGVDRDRLVYIPNGLDLSQWTLRRPDQEDTRVPLIVCAARFVERKRQQDLLHALATLSRSGQPFRAVLVGTGPTLPKMRALASSLRLTGSVELPGAVDAEAVRGLLEQAAIACLPSASEGMPGALMEAMASGVPVVATDVGGTNELVVDGQSGLLVPAYEPRALADALARLLTDAQLRSRLALGGRRRMEERFSLEVMLRSKERLFCDAAARAGPADRSRDRSADG
jgi:glycosyltransferase involved in cell wall biosynthesis